MTTISGQSFYVGPDNEPDKYRLRRQVGSGGEAELWEADMAFAGGRERLAVKILRDRHSADLAGWQDRWAEQADLLRLIRHPGVVGVHQHFAGPPMHRGGEADRSAGALYLVMNWIEGQDLREWVMTHPAPADTLEGLRYLLQVADVLDWLHDGRATPSGRPVVHGDLSPGNVIINPEGQAVLVDFGLFRITQHITSFPSGTPGYRAPELVAGGEYSPATDRYAFAALTYYVLSGQFPDEDPVALAQGLLSLRFAHPPGVTPDYISCMASAHPAQRPPAGEWIRRLRSASSTAIGSGPGLPPLAPIATTRDAASAEELEKPWAGSKADWPAVPMFIRGGRGEFIALLCMIVVGAIVSIVLLVVVEPTDDRGGDPVGAASSSLSTTNSLSPSEPASSSTTTTPPTTTAALATTTTAVETTQPSTAPSADPLALVSVQPESSQFVQGTWRLNGVQYKDSVACLDCSDRSRAQYRLAGRYQQFSATLATENQFESTLRIWLDDSDVIERRATAGQPVDVVIDVTGVQVMTMEMETGDSFQLTLLGSGQLR